MAKYRVYNPNKEVLQKKNWVAERQNARAARVREAAPIDYERTEAPGDNGLISSVPVTENSKNSGRQNGIQSGIAPGNGISGIINSGAAKRYNPNVDYMAKKDEAIKAGNYGLAAQYEKLRNEKIGDMSLPYAVTDDFNYIDRSGYGGEVDRLYRQIGDYNRDGFSYDYESDPRYQQLLKQQKKEAETQYENGLAELSQRFGGDVPANLVAGLLKTKQDTIDNADSYIPQLWQMAQDMWMNEGNQLYNQYNLAASRAAEDYSKWAAERDFRTAGFENEYGRNIDERNYNRGILESDRAFDRGILESDRAFTVDQDRWNREFNLQQQMIPFEQQSAILGYIDNIASAYISNGWDTATAYSKAKEFVTNNLGSYIYKPSQTKAPENAVTNPQAPPESTVTSQPEQSTVTPGSELADTVQRVVKSYEDNHALSVESPEQGTVTDMVEKVIDSYEKNAEKTQTTTTPAKKTTTTTSKKTAPAPLKKYSETKQTKSKEKTEPVGMLVFEDGRLVYKKK